MYIQPYLRAQTDLLADIQADGYTTALGWSAPEVYRAMNRTLAGWQKRVLIPRLYTITGGWVAGTYAYSLPAYVRPPITPQLLRTRPYDEDLPTTGDQTWQDLPGWMEEPEADGGLTLRVTMLTYTQEGRVIWYAPNGRLPTGTAPTTNAEIDADDTSLTMGSAVDCEDTGWVDMDDERLFYAGKGVASSVTTLSNLVRAQNGTTAATHVSGSSVVWGVAVDDLGLYEQLANQTKAYLHQQMLINTSAHETGRHERLMQYYQNEADKFWVGYASQRPSPRMVLDRRFLLR